METASRSQGLPPSAKLVTSPSNAPLVLTSSLSGIRAPLTIDSDYDCSLSTNGYEYSGSSYVSDGGSDGFLDSEDEVEVASERAFVEDPDGEILERTRLFEHFTTSRPSVSFSDREFNKRDVAEESVDCSPFSGDAYEVSSEETTEEDDECDDYHEEPIDAAGVSSLPKPAMPIAKLSANSDDDSLQNESSEDDWFSGAVQVPVVAVSSEITSPARVKVRCVTEEEDGLDSDNSVEQEVVLGSFIGEKALQALSFSEKDSSCIALDEEFLEAREVPVDRYDVDDSEKHSVKKMEQLQSVEQQTESNENGSEEEYNGESEKVVSEMGSVGREMVFSDGDRGVSNKCEITAEISSVVESPVKSNSFQECSGNEAVLVGSLNAADDNFVSETHAMDFPAASGGAGLVSHSPDYLSKEIEDSFLADADCDTSYTLQGSSNFERVHPYLQVFSVDASEVEQINEDSGANLEGDIKHSQETDNEGQQRKIELRTESVTESFDLFCGTPGKIESVDDAVEGNAILGMECAELSGLPATRKNQFTSHDSSAITESDVIEDGVFENISNLEQVRSSMNAELKEETKTALGITENSHTLRHIDAELEQRLDRTFSAGELQQRLCNIPSGEENPFNCLIGVVEPVVLDTDEDLKTDGETEDGQTFDPTAFITSLKALNDVENGSAIITFTSPGHSSILPYKRPTGLCSWLHSPRPTSRSKHLDDHNSSQLKSRDEREENISKAEREKLDKLLQICLKYLRLVRRLGLSFENSAVRQVLHHILISSRKYSGGVFSLESAKRAAMEIEADDENNLDFSLNILVIGRTGVGKSATINTIFGVKKTRTNAFKPATTAVKEIVGTVDGVQLRVLDTPGLVSSQSKEKYNRKILFSMNKFAKKFPPDVVLYVDRLDTPGEIFEDSRLLQLITSYLGPSIWSHAMFTFTHATSVLLDEPSEYPLDRGSLVDKKIRLLKKIISQVSGHPFAMISGLGNPAALIENYSLHDRNGESWRRDLLLSCYSMKILSETSSLEQPRLHIEHHNPSGFRFHVPYFLSLLMPSNYHPKLPSDVIRNIDLYVSDSDEDEYDNLPSLEPLTKSQIARLNKTQGRTYFKEHNYHVKLLQKMRWKEQLKRFRDLKKGGKFCWSCDGSMGDYGAEETGSPAGEPNFCDIEPPSSFLCDCSIYRYRVVQSTPQFILEPASLNTWDHDPGYDGGNLKGNLAIAGLFPASVEFIFKKDKNKFFMHLSSSVAAKHGENITTVAEVDMQTIGEQVVYILKGEAKNFEVNKTASGLSLAIYGTDLVPGFKIKDQVIFGKKLFLVGSVGAVQCGGSPAYAAYFGVHFKEMKQGQTSVGLSVIKGKENQQLECNFQSVCSFGSKAKFSVHASLNNSLKGEICLKASSSQGTQFAILGLIPVVATLIGRLFLGPCEKYSI